MKKTSLSAILDILNGVTYSDETVAELKTELETELNKDKARKEANAKEYEEVKDIILGALSDSPATCGEIYEAIEEELPKSFTRGKVQYALTHLWQDEIVKVEGKPNGYRKA